MMTDKVRKGKFEWGDDDIIITKRSGSSTSITKPVRKTFGSGRKSPNRLVVQAQKGPGRGWWGPPAGTHVPSEDRALTGGETARLKALGATDKDLEGALISGKPGRGMKMSVDGDLFVSTTTGKKYVGLYDKHGQGGIVRLSKSATDGTAMHEIGHHVFRSKTKAVGEIDASMDKIRKFRNTESWASDSNTGLRAYSFTRGGELVADAYRVRRMGTDKQWQNVRDMIINNTHNFIDLEEVF